MSSRVPAVYPTSVNALFLAFFALNEINKLRVITEAENSDSPRLHSPSPYRATANLSPAISTIKRQNPRASKGEGECPP
jgi:hypothetical protein